MKRVSAARQLLVGMTAGAGRRFRFQRGGRVAQNELAIELAPIIRDDRGEIRWGSVNISWLRTTPG
jgi:hypothetical protein